MRLHQGSTQLLRAFGHLRQSCTPRRQVTPATPRQSCARRQRRARLARPVPAPGSTARRFQAPWADGPESPDSFATLTHVGPSRRRSILPVHLHLTGFAAIGLMTYSVAHNIPGELIASSLDPRGLASSFEDAVQQLGQMKGAITTALPMPAPLMAPVIAREQPESLAQPLPNSPPFAICCNTTKASTTAGQQPPVKQPIPTAHTDKVTAPQQYRHRERT
jgi:hypothetical protein